MKERLIMPEYVVVIDRAGLDTVVQKPSDKTSKTAQTSVKIAIIIDAYETGKVVPDYNRPGQRIMDSAEKRTPEAIKAVVSFAQSIRMMKVRAVQHSQNDYLMLRVNMSEKEMKDARSGNPFDGGLSAVFSTTHILHGNRDKLSKWISRMEFEKKQEEE